MPPASRRLRAAVVLVAAILLVPVASTVPASAAPAEVSPPPAVDGELLVRFEPGASARQRDAVRARNGLHRVRDLPLAGAELVRFDGGDHPRAKADRLRLERGVRWAEPNLIWQPGTLVPPTDPEFDTQWGLHNTGQTGGTPGADIGALAAWDVAADTTDVVVAIVDTGVDISHPDLRDQLWVNEAELDGEPGVDDDGNGFIDDIHGWDFYNDNATVFDASDGDSHGTHVAGTVAASTDNALHVAGVSNARIMPLKFLGPDGGSTSDAVRAIDYAIEMGAHIINSSWGGPGYSQALADKIAEAEEKGIFVVAAAGNQGDDNDTTASYPASYPHANVVAVAATDHRDRLATFSNHGATTFDLGAPGSSIVSTIPGNANGSMSGTSMAAPHVSGALAHLLAAYPGLPLEGVKDLLLARTRPVAALEGKTVSGGRLDLARALGVEVAAPELSIADASVVEGPAGTEVSLTFPVTLSAPHPSAVTARWDTGAPEDTATPDVDYRSVTAGELIISAGETSGSVTVQVIGDDEVEGDETFTVTLSSPTGASIARGVATGTIIDDDEAPPPPSGGTSGGGSTGTTGSEPVTSDPAPSEPVTEEPATEEPTTVSSDPAGIGPSASNPLVVTVSAPVGPVTVTTNAGGSVDGYAGVGAGASVEAPSAPSDDPLRLTFDLHVPEGVPADRIVVARNGVAVTATCTTAGMAAPDPCQARRTVVDGVLTITVLSTRASQWDLVTPAVVRTAGVDRLATAIAVSGDSWSKGRASTVVLARSDTYPDALAGGALAVALDGPLLLTGAQALDGAVAAEIARVLPAGGTVRLLGGTAALSPSVADALHGLGFRTERISGTDRFATAVAIAERARSRPGAILVTTGSDFPDALAASAAAGSLDGVVVLTDGPNLPPATADYLARNGDAAVFAVGGPAAAALGDTVPRAVHLVGADRYRTAALVADHLFDATPLVGVATGENFPDALAAGARLGRLGAPLLLSPHAALTEAARTVVAGAERAEVYGGPGALSAGVKDELAQLVR